MKAGSPAFTYIPKLSVMVIKILLIISIVLQLSAAIVAIGLTRVTKYNLSWMLFTVALTCMAFMRFAEYINLTKVQSIRLPDEFFVWAGIVTSLCFATGVFLVQKIFKYIAAADKQRRISERRILNTVIRTEEKERQRFSKDLHDGLGPLLSSAKMSVSALSHMDIDNKDSKEIIKNINHVVDEAVRSLKEISANLSPHVLNNFGLSRAVSNFISRLPHNDVKIDFKTNLKAERFDADVEVIFYRIICELINNSLKHSGASRIDIVLILQDSNLTVHYRDNGCGFNYDIVSLKGMGFSNIQSRISTIKGVARITGMPGEGMEAVIKVHLDNKGKEKESNGK